MIAKVILKLKTMPVTKRAAEESDLAKGSNKSFRITELARLDEMNFFFID